MIETVRLAGRLARAGGRLRTSLVMAGSAVATLVLLVAAAVPQTLTEPDQDTRRFVAVVVLMLTLPVVTLLAAVTRVSAAVRDRRLAALRIIGVSAATTRAVAAVEAVLLSAVGVIIGAVAFVAARPLIESSARSRNWFHGQSLWPSASSWVFVLAGVIGVSLVVAVLPARAVTAAPLSVRRQASTPRPRAWRLIPLVLGICVLTYTVSRHVDPDRTVSKAVVITFFLGAALAALGLPLAAPVAIRLLADGLVRVTSRPSLLLAARRMQQEPAGTNRLVTSLIVALFVITGARFVLVAFETTPQAIRAGKAMSTGPQSATVLVLPGRSANLAAIRAVPGVRTAALDNTIPLPCPANTRCDQALLARCAELPAFRVTVSGCVDGRPTWLRSQWHFPGSEAETAVGHPVTLIRTGKARKVIRSLRIGAVTTVLAMRVRDPMDPNWDSSWPDTLLLPPNYPGAAALLDTTHEREISVVLDGGPRVVSRLQAQAARHGLQAASNESPQDYETVQNYRDILYAIAATLLTIGLAALLITAADAAVQRRKHLASLAMVGVPLGVSRRSQLVQVATPMLVGLPIAAACGLLAGRAYLQLGAAAQPVPWASVTTMLLGATSAGVVVAALTVLGLGRAPRAEDLRRE